MNLPVSQANKEFSSAKSEKDFSRVRVVSASCCPISIWCMNLDCHAQFEEKVPTEKIF